MLAVLFAATGMPTKAKTSAWLLYMAYRKVKECGHAYSNGEDVPQAIVGDCPLPPSAQSGRPHFSET